jgi:hypothetical protein
MGSRASQRSRPTGVAKDSYVDETLFGGKKKPATATAGSRGNTAVITMDELRTIRGKTEKNGQNDAVIISKNDLDRIMMATTIKSKEQVIAEKKLLEEQKNAAMAKSKARKTKMQSLDAQRATKVKPNEFQMAEKNKAETLLSKA